MSSRDGLHFRRWAEAFVRPGLQSDPLGQPQQLHRAGVVPSPSPHLVEAPDELSIYVVEGYYSVIRNKCRLRRYTIRMDGFVSAQAPFSGGELVTKPVVFEGKTLVMNYSTSAAGSVSVETADRVRKAHRGLHAGRLRRDLRRRDRTRGFLEGSSDLSKLAVHRCGSGS